MAIRNIQFNASDFEAGAQYRTKDGKLVTLKHVCIEENLTRVEISGAQKGDTLVLRCGKKYICTGDLSETATRWRARTVEGHALWFDRDGTCKGFDVDYDVVNLIKAPEPEKPRVSLEGLQIGDRFRVRGGEIFTCVKVFSDDDLIRATSKGYSYGVHFRPDGQSNLYQLEAIERLKPSVLEQIRQAIKGLRTEDVRKLVVGEELWCRAQEEAGVVDKIGEEGWIFVEGVRLWYQPFGHEKDELKIELRLR